MATGGKEKTGDDNQVDQIDHHQGEKGAPVMEIRLTLGDEQTGEHQMKGQGDANEKEQQPVKGVDGADQIMVPDEVCRQRNRAVDGDDENAVNGEKIWSQNNPGIHPVGLDMTPFLADMKMIGNRTSKDPDPEGVGDFMTQHIRNHEQALWNDEAEYPEENHPCGKTTKGLCGKESMLYGSGKGLKKGFREDPRRWNQKKGDNKLNE